jgi:PAS domain-containing protein
LILRLASFSCVLFGVVSLLVMIAPAAFPSVAAPLVVSSPEVALGLIFMGFAVRLSRLERYKSSVHLVLQASRVCLLAVGILGMQGVSLLGWAGERMEALPGAGFAPSLCFVIVSCALMAMGGRYASPRAVTTILTLLTGFVASCWISMFLTAAGLTPQIPLFHIELLPALLLTLVAATMTLSSASPGIVELLSAGGTTAEAVRQTFPIAISLPVVLAILRHWAERSGYLHPSLGLHIHVLVSAGAMAVIVGWNIYRLGMSRKMQESIEAAASEIEDQYRLLLESLDEPVWIFDRTGTISFANETGARFLRPGMGVGDGAMMTDVLGVQQCRVVFAEAIFGRQVREVTLYDNQRGRTEARPVCFVHKLKSNFTPDPTVVLVAGTARRATSLPVIDLDQLAITLRKEATYAGHPVPDRGSASE